MIRHILEWLFTYGMVQVGLTINGVNFGTYNPIRKPEMGQQLGDVQVLRKTTHAHAMGGTRSILPVRHWLISPNPVAGNVAGSQAANEAMARWLEEMATNPDVQPLLVRWSNVRALPQDGWWFLKSAKPDYQWTGGGAIPLDMEFHFRAPKGAPLYIGYDGGAIPGSPATQPATNLIAYPPNSTAIITATRSGAEGSYPYVLSPAQKPVSLQASSTDADLFKGGCHVYDAMAPIGTNAVPTNGTFTNANWLEVFGLEHTFTGDLVVTNGLHLYVFSLGGGMLTAYVWNTALGTAAWNQVGNMDLLDPLNGVATLQGVRLRKFGFESVHLDCTMATTTNAALVTVRLDRGQYNFRLYVRPDTFVNTNPALLRWTPAQAGAGIVYNSGGVSDQTFGTGSLASTADAQYGAAFIPNANTQWLYGFLHPKQEAQQPGFTASVLNLGDTAAPAQRSTVTYGFFIVPFPSTLTLQANGFSGTLGTGWSSVADALTRNGVSTAKCASGTASGNDDMLNAAFVPPNAWPGVYDVWFRVRVTSAAGAVAEMTLGLWDSTLGAWIGTQTTFRANQAGTSYVWLKATTSLTLATTNRPRLRALTAATLGTDWFVDEAVIVPKTLSVNNLGPQEQFQQWLFERTTQYPVA